jgi:hypothetical protein
MTQMLRRCSRPVAEKDKPSSMARTAAASADGRSGRFEEKTLNQVAGLRWTDQLLEGISRNWVGGTGRVPTRGMDTSIDDQRRKEHDADGPR